MEWEAIQVENGEKKIPGSWIFSHYYEALNVLFRIENSLRVFVFVVLKTHFGGKWADIQVSSDDESKTTVAALAKKRMAQDQDFGYLGYPINSPLMHLTSGELVRLLTSDSYWKLFKGYFTAAKNVVTLKLQEIGNVRNSLAHFRPISNGDVEVVKQNARQVLPLVEETLGQLGSFKDKVPSNTAEPWFLSLSTIGSPLVTLNIKQSPDEQWICVSMTYAHPRLSERGFDPDTLRILRVINIKTPVILDLYPSLRGYATCVFEQIPWLPSFADPSRGVQKEINIVFSRKVLAESFAEVKSELESLIALISDETDLMRNDDLARGKILSVVEVGATKESAKKFWSLKLEPLLCPITPQAAVEYWGAFRPSSYNFISRTEEFPWMPVAISEEDIPF